MAGFNLPPGCGRLPGEDDDGWVSFFEGIQEAFPDATWLQAEDNLDQLDAVIRHIFDLGYEAGRNDASSDAALFEELEELNDEAARHLL